MKTFPTATRALRRRLGARVSVADDALFRASFDGSKLAFTPEAVVWPRARADIAAVLALGLVIVIVHCRRRRSATSSTSLECIGTVHEVMPRISTSEQFSFGFTTSGVIAYSTDQLANSHGMDSLFPDE
ncbi:MAG: hypothetical protein LBM92_01945 [Opitutaceae bacterium]|nr:hypothetical protein [Opitutaceae bacterium]